MVGLVLLACMDHVVAVGRQVMFRLSLRTSPDLDVRAVGVGRLEVSYAHGVPGSTLIILNKQIVTTLRVLLSPPPACSIALLECTEDVQLFLKVDWVG